VSPASTAGRGRSIRLAILDDNPFIRLPDHTVRPRAALFHRFAEAVVAAGPFEPASYLVPVADLGPGEPPPALPPIDEQRLVVVPTAPFDGIAGYVSGAASIARRNWPVVSEAVRRSDLVWIKAPASNAALAALACRRAGVPRFTWVAGSVREVVRGQRRWGAAAIGAAAAAIVYDATTRALEQTGPAIRLDASMFTSVVTRDDIQATPGAGDTRSRTDGQLRIAWAGRIAEEKGLDDLLVALVRLGAGGLDANLDVLGDGPARPALEARAGELGLDGRVRWHGFVGDRGAYLAALRAADLFVLPSRAEGVPKVVVDAMAAGLPVVATRVGAVPAVLDGGRRGRLVAAGDPGAIADAVAALAADEPEQRRLRQAGLAYAADHTVEAQAAGLVDWLRRRFPDLPWLGRATA
jgi:glycosyltransferase involved in cell wall biosynthesis